MTHDELLTKIKTGNEFLGVKYAPDSHTFALRAIVELHKPIEEDGRLWCSHEACYNHIEFLERDDCDCDYPCPTIQAIEKALG